jgi:hypothetical protein
VKRILIIGGTGHFGGRICRRIVGEAHTELVISSRSKASAEVVANELRQANPSATIAAVSLDQSAPDFDQSLRALHPNIVIHTAGPYQGQDYRVAEACINAGSHYIDLADGRRFVEGFDVLNKAAERNNVLLLTGASTLPGLSSVVIDHFRDRFESIHEIASSIAPAHQTPRGTGTVSAVLSYCGKPFDVMVDGDWTKMHGWQDLKIHRYPDFGTRLAGACDVPDLGLLPDYVPGLKTATFHAALEAKWEQLALWSMGWLTRARLVRDWGNFVPIFRRVSDKLIGLGSDVGGMHIELSGTALDGSPKTLLWNITARQNHGPEIPCSPALILARKLVADEISLRGAHPCLGMFTLSEFDKEVAGLDISWSFDESA